MTARLGIGAGRLGAGSSGLAMEALVRPWTDLLAQQAPKREPLVPQVVRPEAYIEWGAAGSFEGDFRNEAKRLGVSAVIPRSLWPWDGEWREEGRKWQDFEITNPEDSNQRIIVTKTEAVALLGDYPSWMRRSVGFEDRPRPQMRFVFNNTGDDQPPTYRNSKGEDFKPVVLSPLETIVDVSWGGRYCIISAMVEQATGMMVVLELLKPPTGETNDSDYLKGVCGFAQQREVDENNPGSEVLHHPAKWSSDEQNITNHEKLPTGYWGTPGDGGVPKNNYYGNLVVDTAEIPNTSDPRLQPFPVGEPPNVRYIEWKLDQEIGTLIKNIPIEHDLGGALHYTYESRLAKPQTNYSRTWSQKGAGGVAEDVLYPRKLFAYRQWVPAWDERWYPPWCAAALLIDISGLFKFFSDYYVSENAPISVGITIMANKVEKDDAKPTCNLRWAVYRGRADADDSVAKALAEEPPFDEDTVDVDTVWAWLMEPNQRAQEALEGWETVSISGDSLDDNQRQKIWLWDYLHRDVGATPKFIDP